MTKKTISDAVSNISTRHIEEAADYSAKRKSHKPVWTILGATAACLALLIAIGSILTPFNGDGVVAAYAYETNEEITAAGAVMNTGLIRDNGEMTGHPLMFYLSGKDIETVRFSCKNQQINFVDFTGKRDEYGNAQNFTVTYGANESEYYYLTIDWVPNATIRELTDNAEATITSIPTEMREDIIVMEITFANRKTATKAITISLSDDGTFFAFFNDYEISEDDTFVKRSDSKAIPRDILYGDDSEVGVSIDGNPTEYTPQEIQKSTDEEVPEQAPADATIETAKIAAEAYYKNTVFEIISMELKEQTANELSFYVCVSKGGVVQEPNRTIWLELKNGNWQVVNEGY